MHYNFGHGYIKCYSWILGMKSFFFLTQGSSLIIIAIQIHAYLSQLLLVLAKEAKEQPSEINTVGGKKLGIVCLVSLMAKK